MNAPKPLTIWSAPHRVTGHEAGPSMPAPVAALIELPDDAEPLASLIAHIGVSVLALILTITLIVLMGDAMTSIFATG